MYRALSATLRAGLLSTLALAATAAQPLGPPDGNGGRIMGRVTDWNGDGVVGAVVLATGESPARPEWTTTEGSGGFQFTELAPGRYEIWVDKANHRAKRATVRVEESGRSTVILRLERN